MKLSCSLAALIALISIDSRSVHGDCPNERATPVPANDVGTGLAHCDVHIGLFGIDVEIEGPDCYQTIYHFPDHAYCDGEPSEGDMCLQLPSLHATVEHCHCGISLFGVHVVLPICTCTTSGETIDCPNATTVPCPGVVHPH
jgi:hypothetical protein